MVLLVYPVAVRPLPLPHVDLPARGARRCSMPPLRPAQSHGKAAPCAVPPFIYALFIEAQKWGGPGGAQPTAGHGPNPAPSRQKTPNAQNRHLISSPGVVGPCDARRHPARPTGSPRQRPQAGEGWGSNVELSQCIAVLCDNSVPSISSYFLILVLYLNTQYLLYCTFAVGDA